MKILGLDFETQSLELTTNVTEIGAVLVELVPVHPMQPRSEMERKELARYGAIVYDPSYPPQPELIVQLTGITDDILKTDGISPEIALGGLFPLMEQADIIMAHNKAFDEGVFDAQVAKYWPSMGAAMKKEWVCTRTQIEYPAKFSCKKLAHLALDHGCKMDNRELHRATNDVDLMLEMVLDNYHIEDILKYAREPWVYLAADILPPWKDGGVGKDQAYNLGYNWEKPRGDYSPVYPKTWVKKVKQNQVEKEKELAPFRVSVLNSTSTT